MTETAYDWASQARPDQLAPETDWKIWLYFAGRGAGKNRTGAEWVRKMAETPDGPPIFLVGPTLLDVRETMLEGESGLFAVCPPWNQPVYKPSHRTLTWPNGRTARILSAERPDTFCNLNIRIAWANEPPAWSAESFKLFLLSMRRTDARCLITATPKPTEEIRKLLKAAENPLKRVHVTRVSTFANSANLSSDFLRLAAESALSEEFSGDIRDAE